MKMADFPTIPERLISKLDEAFPLTETDKNDTIEDIKWRAAQRSVVNFLRDEWLYQSNHK